MTVRPPIPNAGGDSPSDSPVRGSASRTVRNAERRTQNEEWRGHPPVSSLLVLRSGFCVLSALALALGCATGPAIPSNPYGLQVVGDFATYDRLVARDPEKRLVPLSRTVPGVVIDIRYATSNNFMHTPLYPVAAPFLRAPAAAALREVQSELKREGLGLKIFDAYRPYSVTVRMWEPIRNPDFVADPAKGSRHNRGAAVDLTLVDLRTGAELPMPTPYDDFTPKARQDYSELPPEVIANRAKLRAVMVRHGFEPLPSEWWHFDFHDWPKFELMDLPLIELQKRVTAEIEPTL